MSVGATMKLFFLLSQTDVSTKPVTASPELDYETIDNILVGFNALETEKSIVLDIVPDTEPESPETLMICLSDPGQGEAIGPLNFVVVTIYDDDVGYCFNEDTHVVSENENDGLLSLFIKKNGPTDTETTISVLHVDQTAAFGSDYTISPTVVSFPTGVDTNQVDINIFNDGEIEPLETFHLQLISGGNVVCTAVVWIRDADTCDGLCLNGGICNSDNTCTCLDGFTGFRCEIRQDIPCNLECLNGGVCSGPPETCVCQPGFIGDRCEIDLCPDDYCQNGGHCCLDVDRRLGICLCEDGYTGDICEIALPERRQGIAWTV
ncbi:uncharacterized protein [Amphiura filiformis]|uniref:uncharacterized protein n=1 Tax=Amphiura filiformis TaxID=82378 RepID=UPI003B21AA67